MSDPQHSTMTIPLAFNTGLAASEYMSDDDEAVEDQKPLLAPSTDIRVGASSKRLADPTILIIVHFTG